MTRRLSYTAIRGHVLHLIVCTKRAATSKSQPFLKPGSFTHTSKGAKRPASCLMAQK